MRVLELGQYIAPAYAGMLLAEQGHDVEKWLGPRPDPIQGLRRGDELWQWINHGKRLVERDVRCVLDIQPGDVHAVLDNFRESAWRQWRVDPAEQAARLDVPWVSLRADVGERSFDAIAQAQAWMEHAAYVPFYVGDTTGGLWVAFKLLAVERAGHYVVRQSTALAKLIEGELIIDEPRQRGCPPWDERGTYNAHASKDGGAVDGVRVVYRGEALIEPARDRAWKLQHLRHENGRLII